MNENKLTITHFKSKSMKKYVSLFLAFVSAALLSACGGKKQSQEGEAENDGRKYLVLYYSQTGSTQQVAEELQKRLKADIEAIELVEPYDSDYAKTIERCQKERAEGIKPEIKPLKSQLADYDVIFLGYPVWFGTYALPIGSLLQSADFSGKQIVPFCTFGSGGLESSETELQAALPNATILPGYGVRSARLKAMPEEVNRFLIEREYIEGEVTALPDYAEQQPVTPEEEAIFHAACDDYQFPLGTPVTVGKRGTDTGVDYQFTSKGKDWNGEENTFTIYVTVPNGENVKPEFTRVVR